MEGINQTLQKKMIDIDKARRKKKRLQSEEARYTLILHSARKKLGITTNEYTLADTIHKLSSNRSSIPGWCYASKARLGESLGFSRRSIHNMQQKLETLDIIEIQEGTGYTRTTDKWWQAVEVTKTRVFGDDK